MIYVQLPIKSKQELEKDYEESADAFERALYEFDRRLKKLLELHQIRATIKHRIKSFQSYYQKVQLRNKEANNPDRLFISDVLGIRIVCPFLDDLAAVERLLFKDFDIQEREKKGAEFSFKEFGYDSLHFLITLPRDIMESFHLNDPLVVEIQLRTILQDAWAEVEHEMVYKSQITLFDVNLRRKLAALNANLSLSDMIFHEIRVYQRELQHQLDECRKSFMLMLRNGHSNKESNGSAPSWSPLLNSMNMPNQENQLLEALYAHNAEQYDTAISTYKKILEEAGSQPIHAIVYLQRGMAFFAMGEYDKAANDFSASLEIDPHNEDARRFRELKITAIKAMGE